MLDSKFVISQYTQYRMDEGYCRIDEGNHGHPSRP